MPSEVRVLAQRTIDNEFIVTDVPLRDIEVVTSRLSGPTSISGVLDLSQLPIALEPWGTWLHVEQDHTIRASGILLPWESQSEHGDATVECVGFSGYPHEVHYYGEQQFVNADPLDIVRHIWDHVQGFDFIGVTVDPTTSPIRLGRVEELVEFETGLGEKVSFVAGPYKLNWWTANNCGREIDDLAKQTPFDYHEVSRWNADRTNVEHHLQLGYPRLGKKRFDLKFDEDDNVVDLIPIGEDPDRYMSDVYVTGAGEGRLMVRGHASNRVGSRLRRSTVVSDGSIRTKPSAEALASSELVRRQAFIGAKRIEIDAHNPNARIGTFFAGDDIAVKASYRGHGEMTIWHRILQISYRPETERAILSLRRSDTFDYGKVA